MNNARGGTIQTHGHDAEVKMLSADTAGVGQGATSPQAQQGNVSALWAVGALGFHNQAIYFGHKLCQ